MLCREAMSRGDAPTAIVFAEKVLTLRPGSHTAYADLGLAYLLGGRLENAQHQFEAAVAVAPREWTHHLDLGSVLARRGDITRAETELKTAMRLGPDIAEPYEKLAEFYLEQNRTAEAAEVYALIAERFPSSLSGELGKIMLLNRTGKHHEAAELANFLAAGNAENWRVLVALGSSLNAAGEAEQALTPLERALALRPNSAEVNYQLGLAQFQLGQIPRAELLLTNALSFDAKHFAAQLQLANTYYVLGKTELALTAFQRALKLKPNDAGASANYGGLLFQLGMIEQAEQVYRSAIAAHPDSKQLNYNLGLLLWQKGEQEEARPLISQAAKQGMTLSPEVKAAMSQNAD
jgi:Flp pilus assembly protein TadD